ncbi:oligosaccharide flippase family protein [Pedobacter nyackensis]|uniref:Membrane protein involved in the export of O-antigen and teichoic acid n=1 Tax=Pedobacter nyackensis TaxID=475255 RepID=A0A1W2EUR3_9SPHI|nr:oligosaccharide flippase family protein [Pedobacter nyackensis]SMD12936.1 Membrane protein involved in the export of O-antigen and teichoic acid [Pedobacter nyackensis]
MKDKALLLFNIFKSKHILSLASNGINALIGMVTISMLFRFLSQEDMGNWGFFLTVLLLVDTFRSGFLSTAFVKFYSGSDENRKDEIIGSTWFIAIGITLVFMVINIPAYFVSLHVKDTSITLFLQFFSLNYLLSLPFFVSNCILQGKQRFDRLLILNFSNQGCFLALLIVVIFFGKIDIHTVLYCYLSANFISSAVALICGWTAISKLRFRTWSGVKELYNFGKFSVGTNLSATLLNSADAFIIKLFLGPAYLAIYNAGTKLMQVVEIPLRSFVFTAMPSLSAYFNSNQKLELLQVMKKNIGLITFILMPLLIFGFVFADYAILILGGAKYSHTEAPNILRIFMLISLLYPAERFFALTLDIIHLPKINFLKVMLMVIVTVVTDLVAIKLTGSVYGVAAASIASTLTGLIIGYYYLNKRYNKFTFFNIYGQGYYELIQLLKSNYLNFVTKR